VHGLSHVNNSHILGYLYISGMGKDKKFKFSYAERMSRPKNRNVKVGQKGRGLGQVIYFCNFCTPLNLWSGWKCKLHILYLDWP